MPMLARLMTLGCTLIDYERVVDATDRRLIFFGRFAGLAGAIDTLWALGQRLESEGVTTPFAELLPAHTYDSLEEAEEAIHAVGSMISHTGLPEAVTPVVVGIAGYGNVARGVREILTQLPLREVSPDDLPNLASHASQRTIYQVTFREEHLVERIDGAPFDLQDYYSHGDAYRSRFARHIEDLTILINANYWDERYPRLVTKDEIRELFSGNEAPRLKVIGDLGCDIEGAVECTLRATDPGDPVFVWDPATDEARSGVDGHGPVVLAVDILPAELPREASEEFASTLGPFLPALAKADFRAPFDDLDRPDPIKRAVIVHRGELTPDYAYLREFLDSAS
jgi:alpha-aminoadipic semialdehyde synthase